MTTIKEPSGEPAGQTDKYNAPNNGEVIIGFHIRFKLSSKDDKCEFSKKFS